MLKTKKLFLYYWYKAFLYYWYNFGKLSLALLCLFEATNNDTSGLILALVSGITPGVVEETI